VAQRLTAKDAYLEGKLSLPPGYGLEHGADVLLLRRADGSVAADVQRRGRGPGGGGANRGRGSREERSEARPRASPRKMRGQGREAASMRWGRIGQ
jgi:hypothetical protein